MPLGIKSLPKCRHLAESLMHLSIMLFWVWMVTQDIQRAAWGSMLFSVFIGIFPTAWLTMTVMEHNRVCTAAKAEDPQSLPVK